MSKWISLSVPAAVVIAGSPSAYAVQYLTIAQARQQAFPSASFAEIQAGRIWRAESGGHVAGFFIFDRVIGKHLYIDYTVAFDTTGRVTKVDILQYRESYGGEVRQAGWLAQFVGKTSGSALRVGSDIRNISGATLSSLHLTEGIKRLVGTYGAKGR